MKLLLAVDLASAPDRVIETASPWVAKMQAKVDLLYVDHVPPSVAHIRDQSVLDALEREWQHQSAHIAQRLRVLLEEMPAGQRGEVHAERGIVAHVLAERAAEYDGLVIVTHGRRGIAHAWLGSVAERVVRAVQRPVFVLRMPPS